MVKLFCAIVGVAGSAFPVTIDDSETVGDLKDAIKEKKPDTIKGEADKLQLFLAQKDTAWLTVAGAGAVTLDEHGHPQGFEPMDPTLFLKNPNHFGESFQPGEGQVHVLVVVPEGAVGSASETSAIAQMAKKIDDLHEQTVLTKRKRYVHSNVGSTQGKKLLQDLNIQVEAVRTVQVDVGKGAPVDGFTWESVIDEDGQEVSLTEEMQRKRYREYVERNIGAVLKAKQLCVIGVEKGQDILSVSVPGRDIELAGRTDLLILSDLVEENPFDVQYLPGVKMLIEVKRNVKASSDFQALSELIALDILVDNPVMALLTDLNGKWLFFWVSERINNSARIYKATIKKPGEAFEVIRTLLAQSPTADTEIKLPCIQDPVKRLKLSEVLPPIVEGGESGGIRECIERYHDIASMLGPDIDMARAVARQVTRSIPAFSYFS